MQPVSAQYNHQIESDVEEDVTTPMLGGFVHPSPVFKGGLSAPTRLSTPTVVPVNLTVPQRFTGLRVSGPSLAQSTRIQNLVPRELSQGLTRAGGESRESSKSYPSEPEVIRTERTLQEQIEIAVNRRFEQGVKGRDCDMIAHDESQLIEAVSPATFGSRHWNRLAVDPDKTGNQKTTPGNQGSSTPRMIDNLYAQQASSVRALPARYGVPLSNVGGYANCSQYAPEMDLSDQGEIMNHVQNHRVRSGSSPVQYSTQGDAPIDPKLRRSSIDEYQPRVNLTTRELGRERPYTNENDQKQTALGQGAHRWHPRGNHYNSPTHQGKMESFESPGQNGSTAPFKDGVPTQTESELMRLRIRCSKGLSRYS